MDKESLIHYLSEQLQKLELDNFELASWKLATIKVLDGAIGSGNEFSKTFVELDYEEKMSYEELYPKKIKDVPASLSKFKSTIRECIDQIRLMDSFGQENNTVTINVLKTLQFHLRGSQLEELKKVSREADGGKRREGFLQIIEKMETSTLHNILCDILSKNPIGEKL